MQIWNLLDGNAVDEPSICALNDGQDQDWNSSDWSKQNNVSTNARCFEEQNENAC